MIDRNIAAGTSMALPAGFKLEVKDSVFRDYSAGSFAFHYYVKVSVSGPHKADCETHVLFAIPTASPNNARVQDLGSTSDCKSGGLLTEWFNLEQKLSNAIQSSLIEALSKELDKNGKLDAWEKDDPELATFLQSSLLQGRYCDWRGEPGICLAIGWPQLSAITNRKTLLIARAPKPEGPIDLPSAKKRLEELSLAGADHQAPGPIPFPAGRKANGEIEDADMATFGGLLCRSGAAQGCKLLMDANSPDGRFWRSPRRKGEAETEKLASFSGDQLKGVLHYFVATGDKARVAAFLQYLVNHPTQVPDTIIPIETGYSSCPSYAPTFTCLISGSDWYILKLIASAHGLEASLPGDLSEIEKRYGFNYDALIAEALLIPNGFRLHLVANTAWILRSLGERDPRLSQTISILAGRELDNPFFQYLHVGSDKRVQQLVDTKCTDPAKRSDYSDWAWQRADRDRAWERSMVWDCVFMYGLLTRDPLPWQ